MAQDFWGWLGSLFSGGSEAKPAKQASRAEPRKATPTRQSRQPSWDSPASAAPTAAPAVRNNGRSGGGGGGGGARSFSRATPAAAVTLPATREREEEDEPQGLTPEQSNRIATANDVLVEYEKREGLKPGSLSTPGTTPQYTANGALRQYERKEGLREGTVSDVRATRDSIPNPRPKNWSPYGDDDTFYTKELSQEAYAALAPRQRAAIDANTALAQAIMADKAEYDANAKLATSDKDYVSGVKALFGEERGSENYAPRTLAVLQSLQNTGTANVVGKSDLDDYLTGRRLLREDDLD